MVSRRLFLRGSSATLWLPFLPSALPRSAWGAATPADPRRLLFWFIPNGMLADNYTPTILGPNYDLPFTLEPILPIQPRVTVVSGIENRASQAGLHESCMVGLMSDHLLDLFSAELDGGVTVDQFAAQALGTATPFPSMQLGLDEPWIEGGGNLNTYYTTLSWANGQTPLAQLTDPKTVFDRMFAGSDPDLTEEDVARRAELRKSLLDSVADRTAALKARLSPDDKFKLDQFITGVRELELRIDALAELQCPTPDEPPSSVGFVEGITVMTELMVVALQCDFTRILTFATGASTSQTVYDFLPGVTEPHHFLSHNWSTQTDSKNNLLSMANWQSSMWTTLVEKLAEVQEGSGDLLSNTLVTMVSEFGDSAAHSAVPMVAVLAGGDSGGIVQGHHRNYGSAPHSNLWWAELEYMGVDPTGFGETATGTIDLTIA